MPRGIGNGFITYAVKDNHFTRRQGLLKKPLNVSRRNTWRKTSTEQ